MKLQRLVLRRPKRAAIWRTLISLLLGGVLTIAVAWACSVFSDGNSRNMPQSTAPFFEDLRPATWPELTELTGREGFGMLERTATGFVYVERSADSRRRSSPIEVSVEIAKRYCGFPWLSMYSVQGKVPAMLFTDESGKPNIQWPEFRLLERGILIPIRITTPSGYHKLPLRPMWPGALYSVLFYGVLVFPMVCLVEFGWRRRHCFRDACRRKHGQCLKCNYPVGAFAVCPECGTPVESDE